jgi:hypothetical protein
MTSGSSAGTPQDISSAERLELLLDNGPNDRVYVAGENTRARDRKLYAELDMILTKLQFGSQGQGGR